MNSKQRRKKARRPIELADDFCEGPAEEVVEVAPKKTRAKRVRRAAKSPAAKAKLYNLGPDEWAKFIRAWQASESPAEVAERLKLEDSLEIRTRVSNVAVLARSKGIALKKFSTAATATEAAKLTRAQVWRQVRKFARENPDLFEGPGVLRVAAKKRAK